MFCLKCDVLKCAVTAYSMLAILIHMATRLRTKRQERKMIFKMPHIGAITDHRKPSYDGSFL